MRKSLLLCTLLLAPALAQADECEHSAPRELKLDLAGAKAVVFEVQQHDLRLTGAAGGASELRGRACASRAELLPQLTVSQRRDGDKLVVTLARDNPRSFSLGNQYAYLDIAGNVPNNLPVQLKVGSGDAQVSGVSTLSADVGSGDVEVRAVRGLVTAAVGSGDLDVRDVGSLNLLWVNSGDAKIERVGGDAKIGKIGSGDLELSGARGNVQIGTIGSGDADVRDVGGDLTLESVGSGSLGARGVGGDLSVQRVGSGDVNHSEIKGRVSLPAKR